MDWPDIQTYLCGAGLFSTIDSDFPRIFGYDKEKYSKFIAPYKGRDAIQSAVGLLLPRSTGEIRLDDKNPFNPPIIDPRYLEHPDDTKILLDGT
jgi:choline dehydrogenase-like flavoprotein